jgi:hypothetical protein
MRLQYTRRMKFRVWDIYRDWRQVFEKSTGTGDRCLRNPSGLVTGVWDIYSNWRQVYEMCKVAYDRGLTYLPRLATGVWFLEGVKLISCSLRPEINVSNAQWMTRRREREAAYSPIWRTALTSQTLRCEGLPNRHWLHSKQRKEDSSDVNQYTALLRAWYLLRYIVCPDFERWERRNEVIR